MAAEELPTSLGECEAAFQSVSQALISNKDGLAPIGQYCHDAYLQAEDYQSRSTIKSQTKDYLTDATLQAAYQAHRGATHLMNYLDLQFKELDRIHAQIASLSLQAQVTGQSRDVCDETFPQREHVAVPAEVVASVEPQVPQNDNAVAGATLDLTMFDNVGSGVEESATTRRHTQAPPMERETPPPPVVAVETPPAVEAAPALPGRDEGLSVADTKSPRGAKSPRDVDKKQEKERKEREKREEKERKEREKREKKEKDRSKRKSTLFGGKIKKEKSNDPLPASAPAPDALPPPVVGGDAAPPAPPARADPTGLPPPVVGDNAAPAPPAPPARAPEPSFPPPPTVGAASASSDAASPFPPPPTVGGGGAPPPPPARDTDPAPPAVSSAFPPPPSSMKFPAPKFD